MTLTRAYLIFINLFARLFGVVALIVGIGFLVAAFTVPFNRVMDALIGCLALSIGIATFFAKPVTIEHIGRNRRSMGIPD
jgi:hypothetical protein